MDGGGDARADAVLRGDGGARDHRVPAVVHARGALHRHATPRAGGDVHDRVGVPRDARDGDGALPRHRPAGMERRAGDTHRRARHQQAPIRRLRRQGTETSLLLATQGQNLRRRLGAIRAHERTTRGGRDRVGPDADRPTLEALHQGQQRRRRERRRQAHRKRGISDRPRRSSNVLVAAVPAGYFARGHDRQTARPGHDRNVATTW